jgi:uncharacterized protein YndB with AHSA1/START domain
MKSHGIVSIDLIIKVPPSKVWNIITSKAYAKELGATFDKNAYVESDWQLGSKVHFKYEPDKIVSTGTITKLIEKELIQVGYDFSDFDYEERYTLKAIDDSTSLAILAGEYTADFEAQKVVWNNWLHKVKEIAEK